MFKIFAAQNWDMDGFMIMIVFLVICFIVLLAMLIVRPLLDKINKPKADFLYDSGSIERAPIMDLINQGDFARAIDMAQRLVDFYPDALSWNCLGVAYLREGDLSKSLKAFKNAEKLNSEDPETKKYIAEICIKRRYYPQAISILTKLLEKKPDETQYLSYLGWAYTESKNYNEAINTLFKIPDVKNNIEDSLNLGKAYAGLKKYADAEGIFENVTKLDPDCIEAKNEWKRMIEIQRKHIVNQG